MAVTSAQTSVTTTATALTSAESDDTAGQSVTVRVPAGGSDVYLGGAAVSTANGFKLAAGDAFSCDLSAGEVLYGRVASGTQTVHVLRAGT